jgi:hypothetical protein
MSPLFDTYCRRTIKCVSFINASIASVSNTQSFKLAFNYLSYGTKSEKISLSVAEIMRFKDFVLILPIL